jgi:hypothetical protein
LTARISVVFGSAVGAAGACYRPRRDEFAVLGPGTRRDLRRRLALAEDALRSLCEPYLITSSHGLAALPDEADEPTAALAVADLRLSELSGRPSRLPYLSPCPLELESHPGPRHPVRPIAGRRTTISADVLREVAAPTLP